MSNHVIVLVINVFCCFVQRFLPNAASLATYVVIDGSPRLLPFTGSFSIGCGSIPGRMLDATTCLAGR
jgi:hypothetical protein